MGLFCFSFLLSAMFSIFASSSLPSDVAVVRSNDLTRAWSLYTRDACAYQMVLDNGGRETRAFVAENFSRLRAYRPSQQRSHRKKADTIRALSLASTAQGLLFAMQNSGDFSSFGVFLDALEEQGLERVEALKIIFSGLAAHYRTSPTHVELELDILFYLIRFNEIPPFLLNRGLFASEIANEAFSITGDEFRRIENPANPPSRSRMDQQVYFRNGGLWGIGLTFSELEHYQTQLMACPSLKHLSIVLSSDQVARALASPLMEHIESLHLEIVNPLTVLEGGPELLRATGRRTFRTSDYVPGALARSREMTKNLKRLSVRNRDPRYVWGYGALEHLLGCEQLETLNLHGIYLNWNPRRPPRFHLLSHLKELRINNFWFSGFGNAIQAGRSQEEHGLLLLNQFFKAVHSGLQNLEINQRPMPRISIAPLIARALQMKVFEDLQHVALGQLLLDSGDWNALSQNPSFWKNLFDFECTSHFQSELPAYGEVIARCLSHTTQLRKFLLPGLSVPSATTLQLYGGGKAKSLTEASIPFGIMAADNLRKVLQLPRLQNASTLHLDLDYLLDPEFHEVFENLNAIEAIHFESYYRCVPRTFTPEVQKVIQKLERKGIQLICDGHKLKLTPSL